MENIQMTKEQEEAARLAVRLTPCEGFMRPSIMGFEVYLNGEWRPFLQNDFLFSAKEMLELADKKLYIKSVNTTNHENGRTYERVAVINGRTQETLRDFYIERAQKEHE